MAALDRRMPRDLEALQGLFGRGKTGDVKDRMAAILRDAHDLDVLLGAGGRLRRNAERLAGFRGASVDGTSLFELLHDAYHLTAAAERLRAGQYRGAAQHVTRAVESMSIGLCAAANRLDLVERWGSRGETSFEQYAGEIADLVEGKGYPRAGEYKRMLVAARNAGALWDASAPTAVRALTARAAVTNGAWVGLVTGLVRRSLGAPRRVPDSDYAAIVDRILRRLEF